MGALRGGHEDGVTLAHNVFDEGSADQYGGGGGYGREIGSKHGQAPNGARDFYDNKRQRR